MSAWLYLIVGHLGKNVSLWRTRHEAVGWKCLYHDANDYEIVPVRSVGYLYEEPPQGPDHAGRTAGYDHE